MQSCAVALGKHGIRANAVLPGTIATDINKEDLADTEKRNYMIKRTALGRLGGKQFWYPSIRTNNDYERSQYQMTLRGLWFFWPVTWLNMSLELLSLWMVGYLSTFSSSISAGLCEYIME